MPGIAIKSFPVKSMPCLPFSLKYPTLLSAVLPAQPVLFPHKRAIKSPAPQLFSQHAFAVSKAQEAQANQKPVVTEQRNWAANQIVTWHFISKGPSVDA